MKLDPVVRKQEVKTIGEFIGIGLTTLTLAKLAGADVEADPRSTDFGKIKVGNTRWDIWGGFQQWVRVFSQIASGEKKTTTGKITELSKGKFPFQTRLDVAQSFLAGKLAPIPQLIYEMAQGQKLFGGEITMDRELYEKTIPFYVKDVQEAIKDTGSEAFFTVGVPGFFGIGTQTYKEKVPTNRFNF